ncbi:hypothetical protein D3C86_1885770 [compost metagenome]
MLYLLPCPGINAYAAFSPGFAVDQHYAQQDNDQSRDRIDIDRLIQEDYTPHQPEYRNQKSYTDGFHRTNTLNQVKI